MGWVGRPGAVHRFAMGMGIGMGIAAAGCSLERGSLRTLDVAAPLPRDAAPDESVPDGGYRDASGDAPPLEGGAPGHDAHAPTDAAAPDAAAPDAGSNATPDAGCVSVTIPVAIHATTPPIIDGALREWMLVSEVAQWRSRPDMAIAAPEDADLGANFAWMWDPDALYFALEVRDNIHANPHGGGEIFRGDSLQIAIDVGGNGGSGYDGVNDFEFGFARTTGGLDRWRWFSPVGAAAWSPVFAVERGAEEVTTYEVRLGAEDLGLTRLEAGMTIGAAILLNESDDGLERDGGLTWGDGVFGPKRPDDFVALTLHRGCRAP